MLPRNASPSPLTRAQQENEVATQPSERSFERRINLLKQEATVINRIIAKQRRIFARLSTSDLSPGYQALTARGGQYVEREREVERVRMASNEPYRSYSRAPTVYETYPPRDGAHYVRTAPIDGEIGPSAREDYRLSPTRPGGFRDLLTTDCLTLIDRRYAAFSELFPYANYLQEYVSYAVLQLFQNYHTNLYTSSNRWYIYTNS